MQAVNFFSLQDKARRSTGRLIAYFACAVLVMIAAIYVAIVIGLRHTEFELPWSYHIWNPWVFSIVASVVTLIIGIGAAFKISELSGENGGERIAELMGALRVNPNTTDPDEKKLRNLVEEMAIASGTPVPQVYILEENSINAFAAGMTPGSAVVAVTRGAMTLLSRDELQGVIAHEFSHILNGDMRLNVRLLGILNGILVIATIGWIVLRVLGRSGSSRGSGGGSKKKGGGGGAILFMIIIVGVTFLVLGYIGQVFAGLIQRAISRQREFLADAAAVQFTRNPPGLGGALKKIGGLVKGSLVTDAHAKEISHFFFADGVKRAFGGLFSTHPDLTKRIKRIEPSFDGSFPEVSPSNRKSVAHGAAKKFAAEESVALSKKSTGGEGVFEVRLSPEAVVASVGAPTPSHLTYASVLLAGFPEACAAAARDPFSSRALIFVILLAKQDDIREKQLEHLDGEDTALAAETRRLASLAKEVKSHQRLPLVELCIPALRQLSKEQFGRFMKSMDSLIESDGRVSLFEFSIRRLVHKQYRAAAGIPEVKQSNGSIASFAKPVTVLLSVLARSGGDIVEENMAVAFACGVERLGLEPRPEPLTLDEARNIPALEQALDALNGAPVQIRKAVIDASVACIAADRFVTVAEADLIRVIGDALDCPIPPFLPGEIAG